MRRIILLSTQRSGSTMVCDDLAGAEVFGRPSEYFIRVLEKRDEERDGWNTPVLLLLA